MAVESIRGCGYRKVGAMYLCGEYVHVPCDRLPLALETCPVCGQGIKVSRGFTEIDPLHLWGAHYRCRDNLRPCHVCDPRVGPAYIMLVGKGNYKTPGDFIREAQEVGISKRIPFVPKGLELGKTVLYLAHPLAVEAVQPAILQQAMDIADQSDPKQPRLLEAERNERRLGIFCAFIPQRVEKLVWESELTDEMRAQLEKRGITPIPVPDGDNDHA